MQTCLPLTSGRSCGNLPAKSSQDSFVWRQNRLSGLLFSMVERLVAGEDESDVSLDLLEGVWKLRSGQRVRIELGRL